MHLLIDIGNTTCDFRAYNPDTKTIKPIIRPSTKDDLFKSVSKLLDIINNFDTFTDIYYASVVPEWNTIIREVAYKLNIKAYNLRKDFKPNKTDFKVKDIEHVGSDFIANYYGFLKNYKHSNAVVVSLGTASTILLIQDNKFYGTFISPGVKTSLEGLLKNAALLENMDWKFSDKKIGTDTYDAICLGAINGHYEMIKSMINSLKKNFKIEAILFTGGNCKYYLEQIKKDKFTYDEELIFKGIIETMISK